jgi:hypothetical protein
MQDPIGKISKAKRAEGVAKVWGREGEGRGKKRGKKKNNPFLRQALTEHLGESRCE